MSDAPKDDSRSDFAAQICKLLSPKPPIPEDAQGYEALEAFFEIGLLCGLIGIPPNESQRRFLHALSSKLVAELNVPGSSAADALARALASTIVAAAAGQPISGAERGGSVPRRITSQWL